MARRRWIQDPKTFKLREVTPGPTLHRGNVGEGFVSPVDGTVVDTQQKLRDHNARNNVEQTTDGHFQDWKEAEKRREHVWDSKEAKAERIRQIRRAIGDEV